MATRLPIASGAVSASTPVPDGAEGSFRSDIAFLNDESNTSAPTETKPDKGTIPPPPKPTAKPIPPKVEAKPEVIPPALDDLTADDETEPKETIQESPEELEAKSKFLEEVPEFKEIDAEFPGLLKKYPSVRAALVNEKRFTSIYPTVEDAAESADMRDLYIELSASLLQGKPEVLLNSLHTTDPKATEKFLMNILPMVREADKQLYNRTVEPIIKNFIRGVVKQGEALQNKNLVLAGKHIAALLYPVLKGELPPDAREVENPELTAKEQELLQREQALNNRDAQTFQLSVSTACQKGLQSTIDKYLDPENAMPSLVKRAAIMQIRQEIHEILSKDEPHKSRMAALYNKAKKTGFKDGAESIRIAYLGRVNPLLPALCQKARKDALGEKAGNGNLNPEPSARTIPSSARGGPGRPKPISTKDIDFHNTSDEDILSGDRSRIKFKGKS